MVPSEQFLGINASIALISETAVSAAPAALWIMLPAAAVAVASTLAAL